jgi:HAD superfamily hydrolase (TIGR01509 family)
MIGYTKGVIFDLDGVISDTQKIKTQVSVDMLYDKYGVEITPEEYEETYAGMKTRHIFNNIFKQYDIDDNIETFIDNRILELDAQIELNIPLVPGSIDLIDAFKRAGYKLGLASGGSREWVDKVTKRLNIKSKFDTIAYSDEVEKSKPNPEIYLLAAERLRIDPAKCIVIEDSKNGITAAKSAGMKCIALVENTDDKSYNADLVVSDLRQIDVEKLDLI